LSYYETGNAGFIKMIAITDRAQEVSYLVAEITATEMKPHTTGQTLPAQLVQQSEEKRLEPRRKDNLKKKLLHQMIRSADVLQCQ
jgi:hypothetical protein